MDTGGIPLPPPSVRDLGLIPDDAVEVYPGKVFFLPDSNTILKVGPTVKMAEARAMRFIASHTSIPVPHVHEAYESEGIGYIFMSKIDGEPLGNVWRDLAEEKQAVIAQQLRGFIKEMRDLRGDFYGALWHLPSEDIFFHHLCLALKEDQTYGPYRSRREYNEGLIRALHNSRPTGLLDDDDEAFVHKIMALGDESKVFSHGDFHLGNIMVDANSNITGIIDWQGAGFSIKERDYLEAMLRARNQSWVRALGEIFPDDAKVHYETFRDLNQALVLYSGL